VIDRNAAADSLTLLPLGGVGVIGMNNMLLCCGGDTLLLDSGIMFPGPDEPGVDLVLPPLDVLAKHADSLRAIVLTHGHEDHIGAVPFVLSRHNVPVYGTKFTLGLVREKLIERGLAGKVEMNEVAPGDEIEIGPFKIGFLRVTHSIPDCVSLRINTPIGNILFTGDFKIDRDLPDGTQFDEAGFKKLGDDGVLLMMSDSTNAEVAGWTRSEGTVSTALQRVIGEAKGRILIGMFSSNQYRLKAIVDAARLAGRYTALFGRSLDRYQQIASRTTRVDIAPSDLIDPRDIDLYDDDELVLACTGSQGETRATLRRIASGRHSQVRLRETDTLILSSRRIPGNERSIYEMVDDFARAGVRCVHPGLEPEIHASGHGRAEELRSVLQWVRPRFFIPVHGTHAFMTRHAEIANETGVEQSLVIENGSIVEATQNGLVVKATIACEPWYADGTMQGSAKTLELTRRRELMHQGAVAVAVTLAEDGPRIQVKTAGIIKDSRASKALHDELLGFVSAHPDAELDWLQEEVRRRARRFYKRRIGKRPTAMVMIDGD
jgi:ribonuclease J